MGNQQLWACRCIGRNPKPGPLLVGEIAQQERTEIVHSSVIIHVPEHGGAIVAAGEEVLPIRGEGYIFQAAVSPMRRRIFLLVSSSYN